MRAKILKSSQILRAHMPNFRRPDHILYYAWLLNWLLQYDSFSFWIVTANEINTDMVIQILMLLDVIVHWEKTEEAI